MQADPSPKQPSLSRRRLLQGLGATGAVTLLGPGAVTEAAERPRPRPLAGTSGGYRAELAQAVASAPLIDTHEHLIEEDERLQGVAHSRVPCDDWALLFSHYLDSDLLNAGMPRAELSRFLSAEVDPFDKWTVLEPYWPAVKNTGYARAVRMTLKQLYGVEELSADTVRTVQAGYERIRRPGFYRELLNRQAGIESCQVNCLTGEAFKESAQPVLLMQDLSIVGMFAGPNFNQYTPPTGLTVRSLADWHRVIDWWFERYAAYAVAVKSQNAYSRDIDYERVDPDQAEPVFRKIIDRAPVSGEERKRLEDHLFWYAVDRATAHELPVKLHTGYYAGHNYMPLARLRHNAGSAADLCRRGPEARFVFMHLGYPYYEEFLAVAKHYTNAYVDLCWAWIINPLATKDYLKKHILTAPINKVLPFGGDYIPVEPVVGHAAMARQGLAQALTELVDEGWLSAEDALALVDPICHGNARRLFQLARKSAALAQAPWLPSAPEGS
jgi:uncharacterized protein